MYQESEYYIRLGGSHNEQLSEEQLALLLTQGLDLNVQVKEVDKVD